MRSLILLTCSLALMTAHMPGQAFEFADKDRIVLLGSTLVEREQQHGFFETRLALALAGKQVTVRNLGWSGDTVHGHARSYFGPPKEGLERLARHLETLKPTVLITCYGADLPFEGLETMPAFLSGYRALLDLARASSPKVRIIIIAPPPFENLGPPLPSHEDTNAALSDVRDALKQFAAKQNATFIDSFELMESAMAKPSGTPLTSNGLHYTEAGYRVWSARIIESLGLPKSDPGTPEASALRRAIIRKDFLFFNRWRPANETYLYGFRKHEQGQNAAEIEQFDPLVEAQEKTIAELKAAALAVRKLP